MRPNILLAAVATFLVLLAAVATFLVSSAGTGALESPGPAVAARSWTIVGPVCLKPCDSAASALIAAAAGQPVEIAPDRLTSPLVEACDGRMSHAWTRSSRETAIRGLVGTYGSFDRTLVDLRGDIVEGAATCTDARSPNVVARFILAGDRRAYMLFEGRTLVEMR